MEKIYLIMNKPAGYVCKAEADFHKTIYELLTPELQTLVKEPKRGERLHTVGRLDCDTTGLVLITTDGSFSHRLTAPECHVSKTYVATLAAQVGEREQQEYIEKAQAGVVLPAEKKTPEQISGPVQLKFISSTQCQVTLSEGKFHQVRRLFLALGNKVESLKRTAIGGLELNEKELKPGQYRQLTTEELSRLV